jgi:hypothetical protein
MLKVLHSRVPAFLENETAAAHKIVAHDTHLDVVTFALER